MRFLKQLIEHLLYQMGIIVIPKKRLNDFLLSRRMQKIIRRYKIDCVIDVGANTGQYARFLRRQVGYRGLIISFEPDPANFAKLEKVSQADEQWIIQGYALGKENAKLELNIMKNSEFNSFLDPDHSETDQCLEKNAVVSRIEVDVKTLNEVLPRFRETHEFNRVFLKLDTQGFDLDVFNGASECVDMIAGVQTEVSVLPIYKEMPSVVDSLNLFRSNGFEVSGMYAVSESRFPHALEFDCIYLRCLSAKMSCPLIMRP